PLAPVVRPEVIPLSFAQQRLWLVDQFEQDGTAYLIPHAHHFSGVLNTKALEKSFEELVQRHEILRTTFEMQAGYPVQVIHPIGGMGGMGGGVVGGGGQAKTDPGGGRLSEVGIWKFSDPRGVDGLTGSVKDPHPPTPHLHATLLRDNPE